MNQHHFGVNFENGHKHILSCQYGVVSLSPNQTKFGFISSKKKLRELTYGIQDSCTNYTSFMASLQPCYLNNYCEVEFDKGWVKDIDSCYSLIDDPGFKGVLSLYCKNVVISLNGKEEQSIIKIYFYNFIFAGALPFFYLYYVWA